MNEGFRILLERDAKPLEVEAVLRSTEEGDHGVDGIITDRPSGGRSLIDDWIRRNG
jgi:hypothetical protein